MPLIRQAMIVEFLIATFTREREDYNVVKQYIEASQYDSNLAVFKLLSPGQTTMRNFEIVGVCILKHTSCRNNFALSQENNRPSYLSCKRVDLV